MTISYKQQQVGLSEFNPKNLPLDKTGKCENPEHKEWQDEFNSPKESLILVMMYSDDYVNNWCDCSKKLELSDKEYDKKYVKYQKIKWLEDSEAYYCQGCAEMLDPC